MLPNSNCMDTAQGFLRLTGANGLNGTAAPRTLGLPARIFLKPDLRSGNHEIHEIHQMEWLQADQGLHQIRRGCWRLSNPVFRVLRVFRGFSISVFGLRTPSIPQNTRTSLSASASSSASKHSISLSYEVRRLKTPPEGCQSRRCGACSLRPSSSTSGLGLAPCRGARPSDAAPRWSFPLFPRATTHFQASGLTNSQA